MLRPAGEYNLYCTWLAAGETVDSEYGQPVQTWAANGPLWCYLEGEIFSFGPQGSQSRALIHVRGLRSPEIGAADRILEVVRGYQWRITGMRVDEVKNELLIEAFR